MQVINFVYSCCMKQLQYCALVLIFSLFVLNAVQLHGQVLNFYYGTLHAHSSYSDGNKDSAVSSRSTPFQNYQFAKTAQNFHFLGISEHNHNGAGMARADYAKGLQQADSANANGTFVAMYGMEWGVIGPPGGHVLIYGVNQLIGWDSVGGLPNFDVYNARLDYAGLFAKIARTPGAFASMAHPASSDYGNLFSTPWNATTDSALSGCAIRSGPAFSTDTLYSDPSTSSFEARYKDALKQGYRVGAVLDHDNHYTTFGKTAASRTVVLAPSLTRVNIMEAIKNRRTQSSDDWNVRVSFTINGRPLGSIFSDTANPQISVTVTDPDLETTSSISITFGIPGSGLSPTTLTSSTTGSLSFTHSIALGASFYYYTTVIQADGDRIITAPIWVKKTSIVPVKLVSFTARKEEKGIYCKWQTATEWNADYFELERSNDGRNFYPLTKIPATNSLKTSNYQYVDLNLVGRIIFYRLKQVDIDGSVHYSDIIFLHQDEEQHELAISVYPNPFLEKFTITFDHSLWNKPVVITCYNEIGKEIFSHNYIVSPSQQIDIMTPAELPQGIYNIHIQLADKSVMKHVLKL